MISSHMGVVRETDESKNAMMAAAQKYANKQKR
jgi:hypothetical protein